MKKSLLFILIPFSLIFTGCSASAADPAVENPVQASSTTPSAGMEADAQKPPEASHNAGAEELSTESPSVSVTNPHIEVREGYAAVDYAAGTVSEYSYEAYFITSEDTETTDYYWQFAISRNSELIDILTIEAEEMGMARPELSDILQEADVNFDGVMDILLCLGHWGNQGALSHKCFLGQIVSENTPDKIILTECPSFADIPNPSPDSGQSLILSSWRNSAASHGYGKYKYMDNEFLLTDSLTEFMTLENNKEIWNWTFEERRDGTMQVKETFTNEDYTLDEINEILYGPNSDWKLTDEKWSPIFPY